MTKLALGTHPFLLGFEQLERLVERTAKSGNEGYPPYNIEQTSKTSYRITLAVAGFAAVVLLQAPPLTGTVVRPHSRVEPARCSASPPFKAAPFQVAVWSTHAYSCTEYNR